MLAIHILTYHDGEVYLHHGLLLIFIGTWLALLAKDRG